MDLVQLLVVLFFWSNNHQHDIHCQRNYWISLTAEGTILLPEPKTIQIKCVKENWMLTLTSDTQPIAKLGLKMPNKANPLTKLIQHNIHREHIPKNHKSYHRPSSVTSTTRWGGGSERPKP